jgi:lipoprotein-anchoring transpeptidase ErfK/SrfK
MRIAIAVVGFAVSALASAASAQVSFNTPSPGLGGGFIKLLATGRDPTPRRLAVQPDWTRSVRVAARPDFSPDPYWGADQTDPFIDPPPARRGRAAPLDPSFAIEARTDTTRREVAYHGPDAAGTIVVDTPNKALFHVLPGGRAIRYGIGVGRPGFEWSGMKTVSMKKEWPDWRPPPEMLKRRPDLPRFMEGGAGNPLGARALYLGSSLYRIHGTNEPGTIGRNVSSGCIRMMNHDVIHLYERVAVGTRVRVI